MPFSFNLFSNPALWTVLGTQHTQHTQQTYIHQGKKHSYTHCGWSAAQAELRIVKMILPDDWALGRLGTGLWTVNEELVAPVQLSSAPCDVSHPALCVMDPTLVAWNWQLQVVMFYWQATMCEGIIGRAW